MNSLTVGNREQMIEALTAQAEAREKQWREAHKNDPCELCGGRDQIRIIPTGCLARLTVLCEKCEASLADHTRKMHDAFMRGFRAGMLEPKRQARWKRLFR